MLVDLALGARMAVESVEWMRLVPVEQVDGRDELLKMLDVRLSL